MQMWLTNDCYKNKRGFRIIQKICGFMDDGGPGSDLCYKFYKTKFL